MSRHLAHHFVRLLVTSIVTLGIVAYTGSTASAGGWAVGVLDEVPNATAGATSRVGFTILQHGRTPVDLDDDVGIEIVHGDGTVAFFPASADGATGHYVAAVTFPVEGSYAWNIRMGWFGTHELDPLTVTTPAEDSASSAPPVGSWVVMITVALAAAAVGGRAITRRRARATLSSS